MAPCMRMAEPACSTSYCLPHRPPPLPHCARQPSRSCSQHSATCIQRPQWQLPSRWSSCRSNFRTAAGIKIIESFDGKFELARDSEEALKQLLASPTFAKQVVQETGQEEGIEVTFTGMLFQPVPWSMQTKKGMPAEFEKYSADPDYIIINTPPNFMFQAKIFKPSRLCAIFKKK